jgi:hypothetical protein
MEIDVLVIYFSIFARFTPEFIQVNGQERRLGRNELHQTRNLAIFNHHMYNILLRAVSSVG